MTRVVIVEDHTLVRQSLVKTVGAEPDLEVVGEASRGDEALEVVQRTGAQLVLLDIGIPGEDGLQVAAKIKKTLPDVRVLFLTMHDDDGCVRGAVSVGADGFVPKTATTDELLQALRVVAGGGSYLSPAITRRVLDLAGGRGRGPAGQLTNRELEVLRLLARGRRPGDVADTLYVSVKTVKNHLTSIYAKLGVTTAAQAVAEAYRHGLVTAPAAAR